MPSVLVLMATHNGAEWLGEQVASIAAQRTQGLRVALAACDDASTDETVEQLPSLARDSEIPFQWVESQWLGGGAGRNFFRLMIAVDAQSYDFVALCDQDDIWYPEKLERAIECLRHSGSAAYSAPVRAFWTDGRRAMLRQSHRLTAADFLFEGAGQGCSFVLSRVLFERLQKALRANVDLLFDSVHYHDWALYALTRTLGEQWHFDDRPCLAYRQHGRNDTGARSLGSGMQKRFALIWSGWYGAQTRAMATLCTRIDTRADSLPARYLQLANGEATTAVKVGLGLFVLRNGRRRWTDRAMLLFAAIVGLLQARAT